MVANEDTRALNGLTVQAVGNLLGIKLPANGMARCPFPGHDDDTPSFEVRRQGHRWICYGCDMSGGAIDLVMAYHGKPFLEAKSWLAEKSGLGSRSGRLMPSQTGRRNRNFPAQRPRITARPLRHHPTMRFTASLLLARRFAKTAPVICEIAGSPTRYLHALPSAKCRV